MTFEETGEEETALFAVTEADKKAFLTPWSLVHYLSGAAMKGVGFGFWQSFIFHGMYEIKDRKAHDARKVYNSAENSLGDQAVAMLGWYTTRKGEEGWLWLWLAGWAAASVLGDELG